MMLLWNKKRLAMLLGGGACGLKIRSLICRDNM